MGNFYSIEFQGGLKPCLITETPYSIDVRVKDHAHENILQFWVEYYFYMNSDLTDHSQLLVGDIVPYKYKFYL